MKKQTLNWDELPEAGAASAELAASAHEAWREAAERTGIDLDGFDPDATVEDRVAWALGRRLDVGTTLARHSSKMQHSVSDQVHDDVRDGAKRGIYVPPEAICVDEAVSGRKSRRDGLERTKLLLENGLASVLLVFMFSRIYRVAYRGFGFIQEYVVDSGLRAISVAQDIDTADERQWKKLLYLYAIMDEVALECIADHVYSGLSSLFRSGFVTGALPVGYYGREVEGARPTNRGRPRRIPAVHDEAGALINQHFEWIAQGMSIAEGLRRWVRAGGPVDPRSTGRMTYGAYRRMLSNMRYTGVWAFGRLKNNWNSKLDYTTQVERPDDDVIVVRAEELRIVSDELFLRVQERLDANKLGPRGPRGDRRHHLWDLVTDTFVCGACSTADDGTDVRMYVGGAHGKAMKCKDHHLCTARLQVDRRKAVLAVCEKLREVILDDADTIERVVVRAGQLDAEAEGGIVDLLERARKREAVLTRKLDDLAELAGEGSEEDRSETKRRIRSARSDRDRVRLEERRLRTLLEEGTRPITSERVGEILADLPNLLERGASGELEEDDVYRAAHVFRTMVAGRIEVVAEPRPGRKTSNVIGRFAPDVLRAVRAEAGDSLVEDEPRDGLVTVYLREPPQKDLLARRVHQLVDVEGHSFRSATKLLQSDGENLNSGAVWQIHRRYWEMVGEPPPETPYNNGHRRKTSD